MAPVDPTVAQAVAAVVGQSVGQLKARLFTNPTPVTVETPVSALLSPSEAEMDAKYMVLLGAPHFDDSGNLIIRPAPITFTFSALAGQSEPITGRAITVTNDGVERIIVAEAFDRPLVLSPKARTVILEPTLAFAVKPEAGLTPATVVVAGTAPPRRSRSVRRLAFRGTRRGQLQKLASAIEALGTWDVKEGDKVAKEGGEGIYFNSGGEADFGIQVVLARALECLKATR